MDMTKYRALFFSETHEHLKKMGQLVVQLEKSSDDCPAIEALFREAHSVKGMAASMGFDGTAELAHRLEDMLDQFRREGQVPTHRVDRLLTGIDLLEALVDDLEANLPERDISAYLSDLEENPVPEEPEPDPQQEIAAGVENVPEAADTMQDRSKKWDILLELGPETRMPAARLLLIFNALKRTGEILDSRPEEKSLLEGQARFQLKVRLQSCYEAEELEKMLAGYPEIARQRVDKVARPAPRPHSRREERARTVRVRTELLDQFINLAGEMITNRYRLQSAHRSRDWQDLAGGIDGMSRLVTDLHHHILKVRMMPLESITGHLPRVVRDLARKNGKDIQFSMEGEEIELDRAILEELADPLVHMIRNAVDHGIKEKGTVHIRASREKDLVLLEVTDDGCGIDPETVRAKAVASGLLTLPQARTLPERDVLQLVCRSGFSTAERVTETSGRGVGMDVVKNTVESFGGSLDIFSRTGEGTRIQLKIPLSVAIIQVLMVRCDGRLVGIPITRVQRLMTFSREQIQSTGKKLVIHLDGEVIPLLSLCKMLNLKASPLKGSISVVISEVHGRRVGLVVDALAGQRETFVKSLDFPLNQIPGVTGATILGNGQILFIIDPQLMLEDRQLPSARQAGVTS